jgi:hypothetical protein
MAHKRWIPSSLDKAEKTIMTAMAPPKELVGKDQDQGAPRKKEQNGLDNDASTHSHFGVRLVTKVSTKSTGKEIHPAKDGGGNGGSVIQ